LHAVAGWRAIALSVALAFGVLAAYRWFPGTAKPDEPYRRILPAIRAAQL
jgi:hypothetical protein